MKATLYGQVVGIVQREQPAKSGVTWYITTYQILTTYSGQLVCLENIEVWDRELTKPNEMLENARRKQSGVTILVDVGINRRDKDHPELSCKLVTVEPMAAKLFGSPEPAAPASVAAK